MARRRDAPKLPSVIERFVKTLVVTSKAVALYPPASSMPLEAAQDCAAALHDALGERPELRLIVTKNGLFYHEVPVFPDNPAYEAFAFELYNRRLADVRFHSGTEAKDLVAFLTVLNYPAEDIQASGGFENRLWELGVATITVTEANVTIVDGATLAGLEAQGSSQPLSRPQIDELLAQAYGGRPRDQIMVARFLTDTAAVSDYLSESFREGGVSGLIETGDRFAELAQVACSQAGPTRHELIHALGEALSELDPDLRRGLLVDELLPEARTNESVAAVIRQLDIDEVCKMLVDGIDAESQVSREGLARAIRTLALISMADRDEVVAAAGAAMVGAGLGGGLINDVMEIAAPSRLTVRDRTRAQAAEERPADAIFRMMDLAPTSERTYDETDDPEVVALKDEARLGITDGDIIMALVTLAGLDSRETQFATTMSMLEDSLDVLIDRGEIEIAADACDALKAASENTALAGEQRDRLKRAINRFTRPNDIRNIAHALRLYKPGTPEYEGARRLLDALGGTAIDPLLEQLADEPDMAVRKSMIDVLSEMAPNYITELGSHMSDSRWYVVRNVAGVLGSTHSSAVLPYLERTVRHPEPRVRREGIRALSGINDRRAREMLLTSLSDDDAQNVQLAARYLGSAGVDSAIPGLEQVAKGEGRGNRDTGPRVEAIEALGKLGSRESLPVLESIAGKRSLIGASRARELRAAAESAIARIKAGEVRNDS